MRPAGSLRAEGPLGAGSAVQDPQPQGVARRRRGLAASGLRHEPRREGARGASASASRSSAWISICPSRRRSTLPRSSRRRRAPPTAVLSRPVLVEDSGLAIRAWGGFPGALVKWLEKSAGVAALAADAGRLSGPRRDGDLRDRLLRRRRGRLTARGETQGSIAAVAARDERLRLGRPLHPGG